MLNYAQCGLASLSAVFLLPVHGAKLHALNAWKVWGKWHFGLGLGKFGEFHDNGGIIINVHKVNENRLCAQM